MNIDELRERIDEIREMEARSCSMDPALVTPEYIYRLLGCKVPLEQIKEACKK